MAEHRIEQIAQALASTLANLATTGENAYRTRVYPIDISELPALIMYQTEDQPVEQYAASLTDRLAVFMVEGYAAESADEAIDSQLNRIRAEIEAAIYANRTLGESFVINSTLADIRYQTDGESQQPIGTVAMQWEIHYRHPANNPAT